MHAGEYVKMFENEKTFWWHRGKFFLVKNFMGMHAPQGLSAEILEIGCGSGETAVYLSNFGEVTGIDVAPESLKMSIQNGFLNVITADINTYDISAMSGKFDIVFALDVLEHIQDDLETMRRAFRMLKRGGWFIVNVPAHKFLWSEHDESLHHKRRYHKLEINQKLKDAGFTVVKTSYFVTAAFFPILVIRTWNTFFKKSAYPKTSYMRLPKPLNDFATFVMKLEANILNTHSLPFGTTITVLARRD
jgi:2-polyprenyl-3-methyl-5-hydroxy-6-metoxy-1,4-benzoquinol methylase